MEKKKDGLVTIELDGKTYNLFSILTEGVRVLESVISVPFSKLVYQASKRYGYKNSDLWAVVWGSIYPQNRAMTYEKFLQEVDKSKISIYKLNGMALEILENSMLVEEGEGDSDSKN